MRAIRTRTWILKSPGLFGLTLFWTLRGYATVTVAGHRLKVKSPDYGWVRSAWQGKWEPGVAKCLLNALHEGDTFVDVGAHVGAYSLLAAKLVGTTGQVFAFEPDPVARKTLHRNVLLNKLANLTILPLAVSDRKGSVHLVASRFGDSESSIGSVPAEVGFQQALDVPSTALDDFCQDHRIKPDVVKIDVEGAEAAVFAGGWHTLSKARVVFLEFHPHKIGRDFGVDPDQFWSEVFRLGKAVYQPIIDTTGYWGVAVSPTQRFNKAVRLFLVQRPVNTVLGT